MVLSGIEGESLSNKTINKRELEGRKVEGRIYLAESSREELQDYLIY